MILRLSFELPKRWLKVVLGKSMSLLFKFLRVNRALQFPDLDINSILILNICRLGDLVITEPMVRSIKHRFPSSTITLVVDRKFKKLAEVVFEADHILGIDVGIVSLVSELGKIGRMQFDLTVVPYYNIKHLILSIFVKSRGFVGYFAEQGFGGRYHSTNSLQYINFEGAVGIHLNRKDHVSRWPEAVLQGLFDERLLYRPTIPKDRLESKLSEETRRLLVNSQYPMIGFHIGSGWKYRRWPTEKALDFLNSYEFEANSEFVFFGDITEKESFEQMARNLKINHRSFVGSLDLVETCYVISKCRVFIGPDSGLIHCAAAMSVPTIGLYGPNLPQISQPLSSTSRILFEKVPCSPCDQVFCDQGEKRCMNQISVDQVKNALTELLFMKKA